MSTTKKKKATKSKGPERAKPQKEKGRKGKSGAEHQDEEVKRGKQVAAQRMTAAEVERLDIEAIRRIAQASAEVERIEGELAQTRRVCNEQVAKARVDLKATIESSGGATLKNAKKKLDQILEAHQRCEEAEAGRKMELHVVLDAKKKARAALRKSFENAKQVEINFTGGEGVSSKAELASGEADQPTAVGG